MSESDDEQFATERHPTLGDAARRFVPEKPSPASHSPQPHTTPLMQNAQIGRGTSIVMSIVFLGLIVIPAILCVVPQLHKNTALIRLLQGDVSGRNNVSLSTGLLDETPFNRFLKRSLGWANAKYLRAAMGNVYVGHDGYLFYADDIDMCVGTPLGSMPSSLSVLQVVDFRDQLLQRGVRLVVVPIPCKTAIVPWEIDRNYTRSQGPALNAGYRDWIQALRQQGVDVMDMTDPFWQMSLSGKTTYIPQDSHWMPDTLELCAKLVADHVRPLIGSVPKKQYSTRSSTIYVQGDLVGLMDESTEVKRWPPERMELTQVMDGDGPAVGNAGSQVLLLGDSYTAIFGDSDLSPGGSCGFAQHLMLHLGTPIQVVAGCTKKAPGGREGLALHMDALTNKKFVIWEFTSRVIPGDTVKLPVDQAVPVSSSLTTLR